MNSSYYKIRIRQNLSRLKHHIGQTDNKGKLCIVLFLLFEVVIFAIFGYVEFINFLEYVEPHIAKNYISLPLAIIITLVIAHIYHNKNKPVQDFWNTKRRETIDDVIIFARQSAGDIRSKEELCYLDQQLPRENSAVDNNLAALQQIANINYNYLTHKEVRQLNMYVRSIARYLQFLSQRTHSEIQIHNLETDIVTAERMLSDILISFKITDKITIDALTRPLSVHHVTDDIRQQREIIKHRIRQMLLR